MHEVAYRLGAAMARELREEDKAAVYGYGLEVILGEALKILLLIILSLLLGIFAPVMLAFLAAAGYRALSGGGHCSAYYRCLIAGLLVFPALGGLAAAVGTAWPAHAKPIALALGLYALLVAWRRAPQAPPRKPLSAEKRRRRHAWSVVFILAALPALWFLPVTPAGLLALAGGLAWQSFTLTRGGLAFLGGLDALLGVLNPWERRCLEEC